MKVCAINQHSRPTMPATKAKKLPNQVEDWTRPICYSAAVWHKRLYPIIINGALAAKLWLLKVVSRERKSWWWRVQATWGRFVNELQGVNISVKKPSEASCTRFCRRQAEWMAPPSISTQARALTSSLLERLKVRLLPITKVVVRGGFLWYSGKSITPKSRWRIPVGESS